MAVSGSRTTRGYHYAYCGACGGQAEHDFNGCVECVNRAIARRSRSGKKSQKIVSSSQEIAKIVYSPSDLGELG